MLIGWSLINTCIRTPHYLKMQEQIKYLKEQELLPKKSRIALGQKFLEAPYRGKGIVELLTEIQDNLVSQKYDIYLATVQVTNKPSEFFLKKNSFQLIHQDENRYYFSKAIKKIDTPLKQTVTIDVEEQKFEVLIRPGEAGDEILLHELNRKWLKEAVRNDLSRGFLTSLYSPEEFRQIIDAKEIVVAEINCQDKLLGWYLVNNSVHNEVYEKNINKIQELKKNLFIHFNAKVAIGAQALVEGRFQGKGVRQSMLQLLNKSFIGKYDYMFSSIKKDNTRANKAHLLDNWQLIGNEDKERVYVIYKID